MQNNVTPALGIASPERRLFHWRPLCVAALGVFAGLLLFAVAGVERAPAVLAALLVLLVAALWLCRRAFLPLLLACLALFSALLQCPVAPGAEAGLLTGRVAELPENRGGYYALLLDGAAIDGVPVQGRVRLTISGITEPVYGQRVAVEARFRSIDADWLSYYRYLGVAINASGRAEGWRVSEARTDAYGLLLRAREAIGSRIDALFPDHADAARGILLGGNPAGMNEDTIEQFRTVGIAHLLAVSGLHVGILAGSVLVLLRFVRRLWLRVALLGTFLLAYAALTAFTPSVLRACVMLLCTLPAMPLRRRIDLPSSLSLAFVLVLLVRPFALWNASFQLSFLAVAGLALLMPVLRRSLSVLGESASSAIASGLSVVIATMPATALFFGRYRLPASQRTCWCCRWYRCS